MEYNCIFLDMKSHCSALDAVDISARAEALRKKAFTSTGPSAVLRRSASKHATERTISDRRVMVCYSS